MWILVGPDSCVLPLQFSGPTLAYLDVSAPSSVSSVVMISSVTADHE